MDRQTELKSNNSDATKEKVRACEFRESFVEWWNLAAKNSREQQEAVGRRKTKAA